MAVSREKRLWILSTWEYFTNRGLREPTEQIYGTEVVFEDLYGNRIDLIQLAENPPSSKVRYTAGFAKKMITPTVIILYEWILYRGFGSWSSSSHKWNDDDSMPGLVSPTRRGPVRAGIAMPGNNLTY